VKIELQEQRRLGARDWPTVQDYADAKTDVVNDLLRSL
jgi:hypothetical protein